MKEEGGGRKVKKGIGGKENWKEKGRGTRWEGRGERRDEDREEA